MRVKFLLIILILIIMGQSAFALGQRKTGAMTAVVFVKSMFQLSLSQNNIDFKDAAYGQATASDKGVSVISRASGSDPWYIYVSNDKPLSSGNNVISNDNFSWSGATKGKGEFFGDQYSKFHTEPSVAYVSTGDEAANLPAGTINDFKFRLFIPEDQPAGKYTCTVMFTMTE